MTGLDEKIQLMFEMYHSRRMYGYDEILNQCKDLINYVLGSIPKKKTPERLVIETINILEMRGYSAPEQEEQPIW